MKSIKNLMQILMLLSAPLLLQNCQSLADVVAKGNSANDQIKDLSDPTDAQDAATKAYVDSILGAFGIILPNNYAGTVTDIDGNTYRTVTIGTQTWMAENLRTGSFNDGTPISLVTDNTAWGNLNTPGYCWFDNSVTYKITYGALYNWHTVETGNLCPTDWHVPTDAEWTTLVTYLGGESFAGGKLKETSTTHWDSPNTSATNETGFTALPGGYRYTSGDFFIIGRTGSWWSATESSMNATWHRDMSYGNYSVLRAISGKRSGFSVRCVRD